MRGLIAKERQNYDEAEKHLQDALAIWRDSGSDENVAVDLNDLGALASRRKDYDAAEKYYREALELSRKVGHKEGQAVRLSGLGLLSLDRQQWAEAHQRFEQSLSLARKVSCVDLIADAQYGLARVWEAESRLNLALPPAQEALAIYERLQHRNLAATRELVQRLIAAVQKGAN